MDYFYFYLFIFIHLFWILEGAFCDFQPNQKRGQFEKYILTDTMAVYSSIVIKVRDGQET